MVVRGPSPLDRHAAYLLTLVGEHADRIPAALRCDRLAAPFVGGGTDVVSGWLVIKITAEPETGIIETIDRASTGHRRRKAFA